MLAATFFRVNAKCAHRELAFQRGKSGGGMARKSSAHAVFLPVCFPITLVNGYHIYFLITCRHANVRG